MAAPTVQALKVTFVIPFFYPALQYGGQPQSTYELARALVRRGHQVRVLTTDSAGDARLAAGHRQLDGIDVIYYRNISNWLAFRQRICWPMSLFRDLPRAIQGTDVVHIHELRSTLSISAYGAARKLQVPYVLSSHGGLRHLGRKGLKMLFDAIWGERILRDAAAIIAISPVEESDARSMQVDQRRIQRLPNMISPGEYERLPERGLFRARWGLGSDKMILFLGRLHWIKGADVLIHAFQKVHVLDAATRLVIAGSDDGQESKLRQIVSGLGLNKAVTFTGFLDRPTKLEAFIDADAVVVPSRSEVFGITAIEALLCRRPVLLSDACALDPLPQPEHGVRVFKNEDVEDLARKLGAIVNDSSFQAAATNGRQFVISEFGAEKVSERAESIYLRVLRG